VVLDYTATARPLEDVQAAYQKGDYATALTIYLRWPSRERLRADLPLGDLLAWPGASAGLRTGRDLVITRPLPGEPSRRAYHLGAMYANVCGRSAMTTAQAVVLYRQPVIGGTPLASS